jgi:alpha-N-arabinofuranosidase
MLPKLSLFAVLAGTACADLRLVVRPQITLADGASRKLGVNVNYLMDNDRDWRPAAAVSTGQALTTLGARWLRFPGGEKSDSYLWSHPPYDRPVPSLARTGPSEWPASDRRFTLDDNATYRIATLGFDDFIALCRRLNAEPICVVALDSCYKPATAGGRAPTKAELLVNACEWVRYANVTKNYGVKYWEVGNEGFLATQNGSPPSAAIYGRDIAEFARAMKAIDPTIQIGANGDKETWWRDLLPAAGSAIDFLVAHDYPCWEWGRFDTYRHWRETLTPATDQALRAIKQFAATADRDRLKVAVTEFNAADWSKPHPWPNDNDLGHALVLAEMMGDYLVNPRVLNALLWNTRWIDNAHPVENSLWDAIDADNHLNASGLALALWQHAALDRMVEVARTTDLIRAFGSLATDRRQLAVTLINKSGTPVIIELSIENFTPAPASAADRWTLRGTDISDRRPQLAHEVLPSTPDLQHLTLPATSVTVLRFSVAE